MLLIKKYLKLLLLSFCIIVAVAGLSLIYGAIAHGIFTLRYVFDANFIVGSIIILVGIIIMFLPTTVFTKTGNALEKFTLMERSFINRESKQKKARVVLWLGLFIVVLAGLIQILLSVII